MAGEINSDETLREKIKQKLKIKNTLDTALMPLLISMTV